MALTDRTAITSFIMVDEGAEYFIHPEYLDEEELQYELRIRHELVQGNRRDLSARLRKVIKEEQRNEREVPLTCYSAPSLEIDLCKSKVPQLKTILSAVDKDFESQNRYMTKHLHVEGRLNRIPKVGANMDTSHVIFSVNEMLSECYHEFCAKIRGFKKPKSTQTADKQPMNDNNDLGLSIAVGGSEKVTIEDVESDKELKNDELKSTGAKVTGTKPKNRVQIEVNQPKNLPPNEYDELFRLPKTHTEKQMNSFDLLNKLLHREEESQPRLSDYFRPPMTPIYPNHLESEFNLPNKNPVIAPQALTSSRVNNGANVYPPECFGQDRRSSMPPLSKQPHKSSHTHANNNRTHYASQFEPSTGSIQPIAHDNIGQDFNGQTPSTERQTSQNTSAIETAIIEMATAIGKLVDQVDTLNHRVGINEAQQQQTYTVNTPCPTYTVNSPYQNTNSRAMPPPLAASNFIQPSSHTNAQRPQRVNNNSLPDHRVENVRRVPINKWDCRFTADERSSIPEEKDARAFLKRLEIFRDAEDMSYEELFRKFHYLLKGNALNWYTQYRYEFSNWNELKAGFLKQYTTPLTKFMTAAKLASRRQQKDETATEYIASIIRDFDSMQLFDEEERISVVQNGLLPDLRSRAMSRVWTSVQEMSIWLRQTETADKLYENPSQTQPFVRKFIPRRQTMVVSTQLEEQNGVEITEEKVGSESEEEIGLSQCNAINTRSDQKNFSRNNKPKRSCFNCNSEHHYFNDCDRPIERIFCFRCGKDGALSPNCECRNQRPQPKNFA